MYVARSVTKFATWDNALYWSRVVTYKDVMIWYDMMWYDMILHITLMENRMVAWRKEVRHDSKQS